MESPIELYTSIRSGWLIRVAELFTGPFPLACDCLAWSRWRRFHFLLGALVSRFGWIAVGKISGRDPEAVLASQE